MGGDGAGVPLQVVKIDTDTNRVIVDDKSLATIEQNLKGCGIEKIAVVSVMGAYRTGKSFLLDLFLRYLRLGEGTQKASVAREGEVPYPIPSWLKEGGSRLEEGNSQEDTRGFHWRPGMEKCTEGIWMWSKPFIREVRNADDEMEKVALLLMDTQGAWDNRMSKEQSATIFGLTAVLSSKQIYNISKQIQEDKIENLRYFMEFANAALRLKSEDGGIDIEDRKAFQSLDFLVRDWPNFEDEWTSTECMMQMRSHLAQHMDPGLVREKETIIALHNMFEHIGCFLLPHPGLKIEKKSWTGDLEDIDQDFLRFTDVYVRRVFDENVAPKKILGQALTSKSFGPVLRAFVEAFKDASPAAMSFSAAMAKSTSLLAKDAAIKEYRKKMDQLLEKNKKGADPDFLVSEHEKNVEEVIQHFNKKACFGSKESIDEVKTELKTEVSTVLKWYQDENAKRLEQALVTFTAITLVGTILFILDRISDFTCDWWSSTCVHMSRMFMTTYAAIFGFLLVQVYLLYSERGRMAAMMAGMELGKSCTKLAEQWAVKTRETAKDPTEFKAKVKAQIEKWGNDLNAAKEAAAKMKNSPQKADAPKRASTFAFTPEERRSSEKKED